MILVKKWKYLLCSFLDRIGLKIMFDDHYVKKKSLPGQKKKSFYIVAILDFLEA